MLRYSALALILIVALVPIPASVAEEDAAKVRVEVATASEVPLASTIGLEMADATVAEAFAAIQSALDGRVQFVVRESAKDILLPALTLQGTPVIVTLNLMGQLVPDLDLRISSSDGLRRVGELLEEAGLKAEGLAEYLPASRGTNIVVVDLAHLDANEDEIERELRIVPVGELVVGEEMKIDDIATAIETVWSMEPIGRVATLKYHAETNLLICFGSPRHLQRMEEVIEGIEGHGLEKSQVARIHGLENQLRGVFNEVRQMRVAVKQRQQVTNKLHERIQKLEVELAKAIANQK